MDSSPLRIYRSADGSHWLGKLTAYVPDRAGTLASLAGLFSRHGINIIFFHYNRSEHPNRVVVEVTSPEQGELENSFREIKKEGLYDETLINPHHELDLMDTRSILKIDVGLEHRPGTLGDFASLLRTHNAGVIYMAYNEAVSPNSAQFSIATRDPEEIDSILKDLNEKGHSYSLIYRGADQKEVEDVIGLNLVERFFFKLKKLLDTGDIDRLKRLVSSSRTLSDTLLRFTSEAGKDLEAGHVFTNVLAFASASIARAQRAFACTELPVVEQGGIRLHGFRLPTGGNVYVLEAPDELVMVDGGYGLYYEGMRDMLLEKGLDPSRIRRIYLSHADADHAGMSGYFAKDYGAEVFLPQDAKNVIEHENRAWGSATPFIELNGLFTVLVNEFTRAVFPSKWTPFSTEKKSELGGFPVVDGFSVGGIEFLVLESLGGHVPGQVFFVSPDTGLFFTADYLLNVPSLRPEEREVLSYPRFMMVSTNVDSQLFRKEMAMLSVLVRDIDTKLKDKGLSAVVVPGHGDMYEYEAAE